MMRWWMAGFWAATILPMGLLLAWMRPVLAARRRQASAGVKTAWIGLWLLGAVFLLARPHDDSFTGLDNMTYRQLSHAFLEGRGFHDPDTVLAEVPKELRESFLMHRGPAGRPTRDRVFSLSGFLGVETQPFFMPTLPMAAAGQAPVLSPERFVPLVGALWLGVVLAAGFHAGGGWGIAGVGALVLGTAWPAYFLRGFYAEGVGAMMIGAVAAAASVRPLRGFMTVAAGWMLGFSVSYHATMVVLAVPVGLGLLLEGRSLRRAAGWLAGMLAGFSPFWAMTRWVCQPYGDWTRWASLRDLIIRVPEHRAVALAVGMLAVVSALALWTGFHASVRRRLRRLDERMSPWGWLAVCAFPVLAVLGIPGLAGGVLFKGAVAVWSGIRWPYALLFAAGAGVVLTRRRPVRERFGLAALGWGAWLFVYIQGVETPVGLWSQRRFLPVVLTGISLLAAPMGAGLAAWSRKELLRLAAGAAVVAAGAANLVRWPAAYGCINEKGASAWIRNTAETLGTERWVVFDYYAHSVPYAAGLEHRVLGLGETSHDYWPDVAEWLAGLAARREVWVVSSWSPTALEDGLRLEPVMSVTGRFPVVRTKAFFPAEGGAREVVHHFMRAVPVASGEADAVQDKVLDGSPVGLRGPWGGIRQGMAWTRQGSGVIGPVPEQGGAVRFEAVCAWNPPEDGWTEQILRVTPPWGGSLLRLTVPAGKHRVSGILVRGEDDRELPDTGTYVLDVDRPYDPAHQGLRGYPSDLGVQMQRVIIRIEPGR